MTATDLTEEQRLAEWKATTALTVAHDAVTGALAQPSMVPAARVRLTKAQTEIGTAMQEQAARRTT